MAEPLQIPIIFGPTGSGKTSIAVDAARDFAVEIISADSRAIFRKLNVGTAKPTPAQRSVLQFHLIDIIDPGERYSAFRFIDDADRAIDSIMEAGHIPLVVGGTGLYLRALTEGVMEVAGDDNSIRQKLECELEEIGAAAMHRRLQQIDPVEASAVHPNNVDRVVRALEIYLTGVKKKTELAARGSYKKSKYSFRQFCLALPREALYEAIDARVDRMLRGGLEEEVRELVEQGEKTAVRSANAIGYNEMVDWLDGKISREEASDLIKRNSRRYAKRQMTWLRRMKVPTFDSTDGLKAALHEHLGSFLGRGQS
ncbi:MAG: tRNA (adenosine(37)-N6)-dimethylallyltransferase MiaA [Candidatus Zixiibacteriota bacterium]